MKLTEEEKIRILSIIERFEYLSSQMDSYEKELELLDKKRLDLFQKIKNLSDEIEKLRTEEKEFTQSLISKYGDFKLDIKTLELIKNG